MAINNRIRIIAIFFPVLISYNTFSQQILTLKEAINIATKNYGILKAKSNYVRASIVGIEMARKENLPDLNLSAQQDFGTINGQYGVLFGLQGLAASPAGPPMERQNWNAAFGSLYVTNINWNFFSFGRAKERVHVAEAQVAQDEADYQQEFFQHQVRVSSAYINLLAAQRITLSQLKNLDRAQALANVVIARAKNGLNPGVDSSLANAEVSNAKILFIRARDNEQDQAYQLATLMGTANKNVSLDTVFLSRIPLSLDTTISEKPGIHPLLRYFNSRVDLSNARIRFFNTSKYPTFSTFGIIQGRGSGFDFSYNANNRQAFSKDYFQGVKPTRANYLLGVGVVWNLTGITRIAQQMLSQKFTSQGLQNEYEELDQRLKNQLSLATQKIDNALQSYREAPVGMRAASAAYLQKSVLYKNGLSNIIDVTQALFALNRAETDKDIAFTNVWQALLYKAAATGDFSIFINEF